MSRATWESECRARLAAYEAALNGEGAGVAYPYEELRNWAYSDLKSALAELDALRTLRAATLAESVQAVDALRPGRKYRFDEARAYWDGINAALEALGRLG